MRLMGFFDFLRKKKVEEKVKKELSIDEIKAKISEEEAVLRNKSLKFEEMTKSLIDILIPKLKNSLIPLRSINLEKRREDETLKGIVRENLNLYSSQLENFIETFSLLELLSAPTIILLPSSVTSSSCPFIIPNLRAHFLGSDINCVLSAICITFRFIVYPSKRSK